MQLNKFLFLAFAFVLIGQGCVGGNSVTADVPEEEVEGMMAEGADESDMSDDMPVVDDGDSEDVVIDENADVVIEISGKNFEFSQDEIRVEEGQTVQVIFTSESGFHDWVVDEFDAATAQVQTGGVTSVTFVADKAGEYEYYCSVGEHREMGMVGTLIVE